jgi:ribosomal RNA-processing protein 36
MPLSSKLDRNLRAADESSDDDEYYEVTDRSSSASLIETGAGGDIISSGDEDGAGQASGDEAMVSPSKLSPLHPSTTDEYKSDVSDDGQVQAQMSKVSFGALAKAQDALSKDQSADRKRKRGDDTSRSQEDKLEALRERLRQIKAAKMASSAPTAKPSKKSEGAKKGKAAHEHSGEDEEEEADSDDSESDAAPKSRSSKHAPAVQSSKRMVSRKRKVVDVKKPVFRDPRFDNMGGVTPDDHILGNRYSFLNDYRASEIAELRSTIRKTKNEAEKEKLKKKLLSMESQQKTRENKEKQQEVVRDHKKKEKELIKQGKQPFFLKKCTSHGRSMTGASLVVAC